MKEEYKELLNIFKGLNSFDNYSAREQTANVWCLSWNAISSEGVAHGSAFDKAVFDLEEETITYEKSFGSFDALPYDPLPAKKEQYLSYAKGKLKMFLHSVEEQNYLKRQAKRIDSRANCLLDKWIKDGCK